MKSVLAKIICARPKIKTNQTWEQIDKQMKPLGILLRIRAGVWSQFMSER